MAFVSDISSLEAGLVSILCATLLYGINIVVFFTCLYVILQRKSHGNGIPWFIFCGAIAQFVISTVHIATGWRDILETFIWNLDFPGGPAKYKSMNPARPTAVIAQVVVIINSFLADGILTWRLYMVWNQHLSLRNTITMATYIIIYGIGLGKLTHLNHTNFFEVSQWLVVGLGLSLATHASVTCLIAGRIWWTARNNRGYSGVTQHMVVVWMILESGAIYSVAVIFLVAFGAMKTQVGGLISNIFTQLCGIIPTLIVVRVGLGLTSDQNKPSVLPQAIRFQHPTSQDFELTSVPEETQAAQRGVALALKG